MWKNSVHDCYYSQTIFFVLIFALLLHSLRYSSLFMVLQVNPLQRSWKSVYTFVLLSSVEPPLLCFPLFFLSETMEKKLVEETKQLELDLNDERLRYQNLLNEFSRLEERYDDLKEEMTLMVVSQTLAFLENISAHTKADRRVE